MVRIRADFGRLPSKCSHCRLFGHAVHRCPNLPARDRRLRRAVPGQVCVTQGSPPPPPLSVQVGFPISKLGNPITPLGSESAGPPLEAGPNSTLLNRPVSETLGLQAHSPSLPIPHPLPSLPLALDPLAHSISHPSPTHDLPSGPSSHPPGPTPPRAHPTPVTSSSPVAQSPQNPATPPSLPLQIPGSSAPFSSVIAVVADVADLNRVPPASLPPPSSFPDLTEPPSPTCLASPSFTELLNNQISGDRSHIRSSLLTQPTPTEILSSPPQIHLQSSHCRRPSDSSESPTEPPHLPLSPPSGLASSHPARNLSRSPSKSPPSAIPPSLSEAPPPGSPPGLRSLLTCSPSLPQNSHIYFDSPITSPLPAPLPQNPLLSPTPFSLNQVPQKLSSQPHSKDPSISLTPAFNLFDSPEERDEISKLLNSPEWQNGSRETYSATSRQNFRKTDAP